MPWVRKAKTSFQVATREGVRRHDASDHSPHDAVEFQVAMRDGLRRHKDQHERLLRGEGVSSRYARWVASALACDIVQTKAFVCFKSLCAMGCVGTGRMSPSGRTSG